MTSSWIEYFGRISAWLDKKCRFLIHGTILSQSYFLLLIPYIALQQMRVLLKTPFLQSLFKGSTKVNNFLVKLALVGTERRVQRANQISWLESSQSALVINNCSTREFLGSHYFDLSCLRLGRNQHQQKLWGQFWKLLPLLDHLRSPKVSQEGFHIIQYII